MKRVLVLGGTQFFGRRLVELLLKEGVDVTIATRGKAADSFGNQVKRLVLDRADKESMKKAVGDGSWDVVYDQICFSSSEAYASVEIFKDRCQKYVLTSSMAVYEFGENWHEEGYDPYTYPIELKERHEYEGFLGYQEAKRQAEAVLFQKAGFDVVAVRPSLVIGEDDYTERLKFHVDHVLAEKPIAALNPDASLGFITSLDTAVVLYHSGMSDFVGPINASSGSMSLSALLSQIEKQLGKKSLLYKDGDSSPYSFPKSLSISNDKAKQLGIAFEPLEHSMERLISFYAK